MSEAAASPIPQTRRRTAADAATSAGVVLAGAASLAMFGPGARAAVTAFFVGVLVVLSRIDIDHRILPNRIVLPSAAIVFAAQTAFFPEHAVEWLLAPVLAFALFLLVYLVYPNGIGLGDVKLMLLLGAGLGYAVFSALLAGSLLILPVAMFLLARQGAAARKQALPFGPFLAGGAALIVFLG